jgi:hypothetical protein
MPTATRTLNPLHFEDLEPHRFEDLVRQLAYDFREWASLEALGRTGSDEGMDIRGIERVPISEPPTFDELSVDDQDPESLVPQGVEHVWVIQCKRERRLGPKRLRTIVSSGLAQMSPPPHGYILAAACDFTLSARNAFKEEARAHGVQEYHLWGKGEIEDQLTLPKNDHLLFAYFGISLQVRRRATRTLARSRLALKRRLVKILGELREPHFKAVLILDPRDEAYPKVGDKATFIAQPLWRYWWFHSHQPPDHLAFVFRKYYASVDWNTSEWDAVESHDVGIPGYPQLHGLDRGSWDPSGQADLLNAYWERNVPEDNRAWALELRIIHYDRILAIDELGDVYNEGPHLLVDFLGTVDPFEPSTYYLLESAKPFFKNALLPANGTRVERFPSVIPDQREQYRQELQDRLNQTRH